MQVSPYPINSEKVIPLVVKSLKNPRSAVCKTACMTSADIFSAYNNHITDLLEPLVTFLSLLYSFTVYCELYLFLQLFIHFMLSAYSTTPQVFPRQTVCLRGSRESFNSNDQICFPNLAVTKAATLSQKQESSDPCQSIIMLFSKCSSTGNASSTSYISLTKASHVM